MADIKAFRRANNLRQRELADYLGVSITFISHAETGISKLPKEKYFQILNNNNGWDVSMLLAEVQSATMDAESRLSAVLNDLKVKAPTFAKSLEGISYQNLLDIQTGRVKSISNKIATAIVAKYPQYNLKWLLTGEGEMLNQSAPTTTQQGDNFSRRIIETLMEHIEKLKEQLQTMNCKCQEQEKYIEELQREIDNETSQK